MYNATIISTVADDRNESAAILKYMSTSTRTITEVPRFLGVSMPGSIRYASTSPQPSFSTAFSLDLEYTDIYQGSLSENIVKLSRIAKLEKNWNGYGAMPIDVSLINMMTGLLPDLAVQPQLFPTACDTIQLEYEKPDGDYLEFTIGNNKISAYMMDVHGNEVYEESIDSIVKVNDLIKKFYGIHVYDVY